jgi:amidohydrolase
VSINTLIDQAATSLGDDLVQLRREIHRNPELAFAEYETSALLQRRLLALGLHPRVGIAGTGLAVVVNGSAPGRTVAVRGDLDALPIHEASGTPFASTRPGLMHACGHDIHAAIAFGVACVMNALRDHFEGAVKVIFQPAEETLQGAAAMIAEGVLENPAVDAIIGYHNWPALPAGTLGYHPGIVMASSDAFDIRLRGKAGHGAHPHTAVDAIVGAGQLLTQLQTIVSREIAPNRSAVLSIGQIHGGTARNVIADEVVLSGALRSLDPSISLQAEAAFRRILDGVCASMRMSYELDWKRLTPVLENDPATLRVVIAAVTDMVGAENVRVLPEPSMGSEDFAWFAQRVPAAHLRIGSKIDGLKTELHQPNYDCNEAAIGIGVRTISRAAYSLLDRKAQRPVICKELLRV